MVLLWPHDQSQSNEMLKLNNCVSNLTKCHKDWCYTTCRFSAVYKSLVGGGGECPPVHRVKQTGCTTPKKVSILDSSRQDSTPS